MGCCGNTSSVEEEIVISSNVHSSSVRTRNGSVINGPDRILPEPDDPTRISRIRKKIDHYEVRQDFPAAQKHVRSFRTLGDICEGDE